MTRIHLDGVEGTMYATMCVRARSRRIDDPLAENMRTRLMPYMDVDHTDWRVRSGVVRRTLMFDAYVRRFLQEQPDAFIINLGAGLDTRFNRLDNGKATWVHVDLPGPMAVRHEFVQPNERMIDISADIRKCVWAHGLRPQQRQVLVIIEGVSMYLSREDMAKVLANIRQYFPNALILCDLMREKHLEKKLFTDKGIRFNYGVRNAADLLELHEDLELVVTRAISQRRFRSMDTIAGLYRFRDQAAVAQPEEECPTNRDD